LIFRGSIEAVEDGVEFGLLFSRPSAGQRRGAPHHHGAGGSGGETPKSLFDLLDELGSFKQGKWVFSDFENRVRFGCP